MFIVKKCWQVRKLYISSVYLYLYRYFMYDNIYDIYLYTHTITKPKQILKYAKGF